MGSTAGTKPFGRASRTKALRYSLREEACDSCGKPLVELLLGRDEVRPTPSPASASLHAYGECWALCFDGVPPA
jgi:hypothetical protein